MNAMREQLLGFLTESLSEEEHALVKQRLEDDPELQREAALLDTVLEPLRSDDLALAAPQGLARRTCDRIPRPESVELRSSTGNWRLADTLVAGGIVAAAAMLFFPALMSSRAVARLDACGNNMHYLHTALVDYADSHSGRFPEILPTGNQSFAGIYAVRLAESGLIDHARRLVCPSSSLADEQATFRVPTSAQLASASGAQLHALQSTAGGSYGYTMGYIAGGSYRATRNLGRRFFALMADVFDPSEGKPQSSNHGGCGQNVLFEDGHVVYLTSCCAEGCCDDFFRNDRGHISAGIHRDDSVIGHSAASPWPAQSQIKFVPAVR